MFPTINITIVFKMNEEISLFEFEMFFNSSMRTTSQMYLTADFQEMR